MGLGLLLLVVSFSFKRVFRQAIDERVHELHGARIAVCRVGRACGSVLGALGRVLRLSSAVGEVRVDALLRHVFSVLLYLDVQLRDAMNCVEIGNDDVTHDVAGCANDESACKCRRTLDVPPWRVGHEVDDQLLAPGSADEGAQQRDVQADQCRIEYRSLKEDTEREPIDLIREPYRERDCRERRNRHEPTADACDSRWVAR